MTQTPQPIVVAPLASVEKQAASLTQEVFKGKKLKGQRIKEEDKC